MRHFAALSAALCVAASASIAAAANVNSGIEVGDPIGAYQAIKCGGIDDGVELDKSLCYT